MYVHIYIYIYIARNLGFEGCGSQARWEFPGRFESSNLSRGDLSRAASSLSFILVAGVRLKEAIDA